MMQEFKEFAMKGSLIDIAVGFVMGAAFAKVTSAFIDGVIMPVVGMIQGKDMSAMKCVLKAAETGSDGVETAAEVSIKYGTLISVTVEFLVVALVMFMVIKSINKMKKKQAEAPAAPPAPTASETLLTEIRDALKK